MRVDEQEIRTLTDQQYTKLRDEYNENKQVSVVFLLQILKSELHFVFCSQKRKTFERDFKHEDFRYILFAGKSTALWQISPPSRTALEYLLQTEPSFIPLVFSWTITR